MANARQSLASVGGGRAAEGGGSSAATPIAGRGAPAAEKNMAIAGKLVKDLCNPDLREKALAELYKNRRLFQDLAPLLWKSFGAIAVLLQEITSIYPLLSPPNLSPAQSNRCVAAHPGTRMPFLKADTPLYVYPFLNTIINSSPFEYLRLASLGVIGALVKADDTDVVIYLFPTEITPLCLRIMDMGSELSKTVATFIVQKILLIDAGLDYICATAERFFALNRVLGNMVVILAVQPSWRLLKYIIQCYLRLSDNPFAREALRNSLPEKLRDNTFNNCLRLIHKVGVIQVGLQPGAAIENMPVN